MACIGIRQQTIMLANGDPDLCYNMVSLGPNELTSDGIVTVLLPNDIRPSGFGNIRSGYLS